MQTRRLALSLVTAGAVVGLAACGGGEPDAGGSAANSGGEKISVTANNGTVEIPAKPQRVVALDSTSFETLQAMGVTPVAAPKPLLPDQLKDWESNANIVDVGTHREPQLEAVNAAEPDLIVGGSRFERYTDQLSKIAPVIDLAPNSDKPSGYAAALKKQTTDLGTIFGKKDVADRLNADLDASTAKAKQAAGTKTVFLANHSAGKLDNGAGRMAPLIAPLGLKNVFPGTEADSEAAHNDSGLAPETVAQKNPDVMIVMDRDAATREGANKAPAQQTVKAQTAWANTNFVKNDAIVYLDPQYYVTEGIVAYTDAYDLIADKLGGPASASSTPSASASS